MTSQFLRRKDAGAYLKAKYGFGSEKTLAKLACIGGGRRGPKKDGRAAVLDCGPGGGVMMGAPERRNPPLCDRGGLGNVHCLAAADNREYSALSESSEVIAATFVTRRYRLAPPLARLVCDLADIGRRIA